MAARERPKVVILGAGFAGFGLSRELERLGAAGEDFEVTVIGREPHCVLTPLLFEVVSGTLAPCHAVNRLAPSLQRTRFLQAEVASVDFERRHVRLHGGADQPAFELAYDHLVLALGGVASDRGIPGAQHARTFKTLEDAKSLGAHLRTLTAEIPRVPPGSARDAAATVVVVGGGLVGVELAGELAAFVPRLLREAGLAERIHPRVLLLESGPRLLPELDEDLAREAARELGLQGVSIAVGSAVESIDPAGVTFADGGFLPAWTVVLATGVAANPLLSAFPLAHDRCGRVIVDASLRSVDRPEVWALGDCACVPSPAGGFCAPLAQHAVRQAERLATNLLADARGHRLWPYAHEAIGFMASLGPQLAVTQLGPWRAWGSWVYWLRQGFYLWDLSTGDTRHGIAADRLVSWLRSPFADRLVLGGLLPPGWPPTGVDRLPVRVTFAPWAPDEAPLPERDDGH